MVWRTLRVVFTNFQKALGLLLTSLATLICKFRRALLIDDTALFLAVVYLALLWVVLTYFNLLKACFLTEIALLACGLDHIGLELESLVYFGMCSSVSAHRMNSSVSLIPLTVLSLKIRGQSTVPRALHILPYFPLLSIKRGLDETLGLSTQGIQKTIDAWSLRPNGAVQVIV